MAWVTLRVLIRMALQITTAQSFKLETVTAQLLDSLIPTTSRTLIKMVLVQRFLLPKAVMIMFPTLIKVILPGLPRLV